MKIDNINIDNTIKEARKFLDEEKNLSSGFKAIINVLLILITILANRLKLNSSNSSIPPSRDPNRLRKKKEKSGKKPGGQNGHKGTRLGQFENPDKIEFIKINKKTLPKGNYQEIGYESRQVVDIKISRVVTEYRAQILQDDFGNKYTAPFPVDVTSDVQYGNELKAHCVYMSQFQLLPYNRIQDYFNEQMGVPLSTGSIFNFNKEAFDLLEKFESIVKNKLINSELLHADETGINVDAKRIWLHSASNDLWTFFCPHQKRGSDAMDDINIIPNFIGTLCHDHWQAYYKYKQCLHALCNGHHLRELERAIEEDKYKWAKDMQNLLLEIKKAVEDAGGELSINDIEKCRSKYKEVLKNANLECPEIIKREEKGKRGRIKQSKSRNLLERLINYEDDTLRFMENKIVPFTNNLSENDIRMTKVQQKISGCFRSMEGAYMFCRIRGYLSTCRKHGLTATKALSMLFEGQLPDFIGIHS
jgi:transposase